jgi:hypothetical protein
MRNAGNDGLEDRRPAIHNNNNNNSQSHDDCQMSDFMMIKKT